MSFPLNYQKILDKYAKKGYRLLALAYKMYKNKPSEIQNRVNMECDLSFLGFILFENKLKNESQKTINVLKGADIEVKMVTGDNMLTAVTIALQC